MRRIQAAVRDRCGCYFDSYFRIHSGEFSCQTTETNVIYRAIIKGTSDFHTAEELLDYIDDWRQNDQTLLHNLFRLRMSRDCPLKIASFNEVECKTDDQKTKLYDNNNKGSNGILFGTGKCYSFQACDSGDGGSGGDLDESSIDNNLVPA